MSSDLQLDRNLVSVSGFGYRENILYRKMPGSAPAKENVLGRSRMILLTPAVAYGSSEFPTGLLDISALHRGRTDTTSHLR
ncbi:MAG TPA: hypothetical protein VGO22_03050 [Pseudorhizobium sp.]|jgi:hypothetical protein|nr:hypothetical protein [Pseudorhizobium sp.]